MRFKAKFGLLQPVADGFGMEAHNEYMGEVFCGDAPTVSGDLSGHWDDYCDFVSGLTSDGSREVGCRNHAGGRVGTRHPRHARGTADHVRGIRGREKVTSTRKRSIHARLRSRRAVSLRLSFRAHSQTNIEWPLKGGMEIFPSTLLFNR